MGIVRMGPPTDMICKLKRTFDIKIFVETGTFLGNTAYWASTNFDRVFTIEGAEDLFQRTAKRFKHVDNIQFVFGDSRNGLLEIVSQVDGPAIFWLDAHWSGGETYGEFGECPIIREIEIINHSKYDSFIFIDDARLFLSPPPRPHKIEHWPNIITLLNTLQENDAGRYIVVFDDVIIAVPEYAKPIVAECCQHISSIEFDRHHTKRQTTTLKILKRLNELTDRLFADIENLVK